MLILNKEQHLEYLDNIILNSITSVSKISSLNVKFLIIVQAIEILGAYLDNKPFRAKEQSSQRFELAIYKLFPSSYKSFNTKNFLYYQLRNFLVHSLISSSKIVLYEDISNYEHLYYNKDVLYISYSDFFNDFVFAFNKLKFMILNDKVKLKKILY